MTAYRFLKALLNSPQSHRRGGTHTQRIGQSFLPGRQRVGQEMRAAGRRGLGIDARNWLQSGVLSLTFVVDQLPSHVGIDLGNKLIDRNSDDNPDRVDEEIGGVSAKTTTASASIGTGVS